MTKHCESCFVVLVRKRHPSGKWFTNRRFCSSECHRRHRRREARKDLKLWATYTRVYVPFEKHEAPSPAMMGLGPLASG